MADFAVDLEKEIEDLKGLRDKVDAEWPAADFDDKLKIEALIPEITEKIAHLENLCNLRKTSRITISGLTVEEKDQMSKALEALHRVIQQDQTLQEILRTMTTILEGADLIFTKGSGVKKDMRFALSETPPTGGNSEELKKAKEAANIAAELKKAAEAKRDAVKADLERQNAEATRGLGLVQAQADIIAKLLPKGEAKPLEGKVDIKDVGSMARLVAYQAMKVMASEIAEVLGKVLQGSDKVMIVPQLDFASGDLPLVEIMEQFDLFQQLLAAQLQENRQILQEPPPPVKAAAFAFAAPVSPVTALLAMAGTVIPGLANLAGYFKTDYTITGYEFDLDKEGLVARVAGAVRQKGKEIYLYNFYTLGDLAALPIIKTFAHLSQLSLDLESSKARLAAKKAGVPTGGDTSKIDGALKDSQALLDAVKSYAQAITTKTAGEDYPRLVRAALRDRVRQMDITHLLYLNVLPKSGGEAITKKNFWRNTKAVGYLGGAAVSYVLAEKGGRITLGDTLIRLSVFNYRLVAPEESDLKSIPLD